MYILDHVASMQVPSIASSGGLEMPFQFQSVNSLFTSIDAWTRFKF